MKDRDTPLRMVRKWSKLQKDIYERMDEIRLLNQEFGIEWPDYCHCPSELMLLTHHSFDENIRYKAEKEMLCGEFELETCWLWRKHKPIYWFDSDLAEMLCNQAASLSKTEVLPADLLLKPPYPAIYVKAPGISEGKDGFFYWVDYGLFTKTTVLIMLFVNDDMTTGDTIVFDLIPGSSIGDCIQNMAQMAMNKLHDSSHNELKAMSDKYEDIVLNLSSAMAEEALKALQFVLYIVSENADISRHPMEMPIVGPSVKKAKYEDRANAVQGYSVGIRIGAAIRKNKNVVKGRLTDSTAVGSSKCPHSRRGHWHHYWTGPRNGERKLILKWLAPMYINMGPSDIDENSATVYPVVN